MQPQSVLHGSQFGLFTVAFHEHIPITFPLITLRSVDQRKENVPSISFQPKFWTVGVLGNLTIELVHMMHWKMLDGNFWSLSLFGGSIFLALLISRVVKDFSPRYNKLINYFIIWMSFSVNSLMDMHKDNFAKNFVNPLQKSSIAFHTLTFPKPRNTVVELHPGSKWKNGRFLHCIGPKKHVPHEQAAKCRSSILNLNFFGSYLNKKRKVNSKNAHVSSFQ